MKKCQKCGAPLEGFLYNTIGKLIGLKPSSKNPDLCNKCDAGAEIKPDKEAPKEPENKTESIEPEPKENMQA